MQSVTRLGSGNSRAKEWVLISPDNKKFEVKGTLKQFCKIHNLSMRILKRNINSKVVKFDFQSPTAKLNTIGWSLYEANVFREFKDQENSI